MLYACILEFSLLNVGSRQDLTVGTVKVQMAIWILKDGILLIAPCMSLLTGLSRDVRREIAICH